MKRQGRKQCPFCGEYRRLEVHPGDLRSQYATHVRVCLKRQAWRQARKEGAR